MKMLAFHHIALSVSDLERSITFYEALGFQAVMHWQAEDHSLRIAHLKIGDMLLELFCYTQFNTAPTSSATLNSDLPRLGTKHFGLRCSDIYAMKAKLEHQGLGQNIEITHGRTGIDYFFLKDPDGIFVEIVQDDRTLYIEAHRESGA